MNQHPSTSCWRGVLVGLPLSALLWIGIGASVHAADAFTTAKLAPYVAMIAGNTADVLTTKQAFNRGAVEANPFMAGANIQHITAAKVAGVASVSTVMVLLQTHNHPKAAKWIGYIDGSVMFAAAIHNTQVRR